MMDIKYAEIKNAIKWLLNMLRSNEEEVEGGRRVQRYKRHLLLYTLGSVNHDPNPQSGQDWVGSDSISGQAGGYRSLGATRAGMWYLL